MRTKPINLTNFIAYLVLVMVGCTCISIAPDDISVKNLLEKSIEENKVKTSNESRHQEELFEINN